MAKKVLGELRKWRHFGAMQRLADALIRLGCDAHVVYRQYAQALIDRGELIPALELLLALAGRAKDDPQEYSQACGCWAAYISRSTLRPRVADSAWQKLR